MNDTDFFVPEHKAARLARLYGLGDDDTIVAADSGYLTAMPTSAPALCRGGGALASTAHDYLTFARALLGGGQADGVRILSPESTQALRTNRLTPAQRRLPSFGIPYWTGRGFGLGLSVVMESQRGRVVRAWAARAPSAGQELSAPGGTPTRRPMRSSCSCRNGACPSWTRRPPWPARRRSGCSCYTSNSDRRCTQRCDRRASVPVRLEQPARHRDPTVGFLTEFCEIASAAVLETVTVGIQAGRTDVVDGPIFGHDLTQLGLADRAVRRYRAGRPPCRRPARCNWRPVPPHGRSTAGTPPAAALASNGTAWNQ